MGLDINTCHCAPRGQGIKNVAVNILSNLGYSKPILSNDLSIYLSIYLFIYLFAKIQLMLKYIGLQ